MKGIEYFCRLFAQLRRSPGPSWDEATNRRAPHKPLLLLAVLDLVERGRFTSNFIAITNELTELNELFVGYWKKILPLHQNSSIAFPFSRLHNEPFWKLVPASEKPIDRSAIESIKTVPQLRQASLGALVDEELFSLMLNKTNRDLLAATIFKFHFSESARQLLIDERSVNGEAFKYSKVLLGMVNSEDISEHVVSDDYREIARYKGFRQAIIVNYDHRCALCGIRIVTQEGYSVVDAAHIIPWSVSKNDDPRNGMALCKLCHWSFDNWLITVSDSYTVIVTRQLGAHPNASGFLLTLSDRHIVAPLDQSVWPGRDYIRWHRSKTLAGAT